MRRGRMDGRGGQDQEHEEELVLVVVVVPVGVGGWGERWWWLVHVGKEEARRRISPFPSIPVLPRGIHAPPPQPHPTHHTLHDRHRRPLLLLVLELPGAL